MASQQSIGNLSATLSADATQLITAFAAAQAAIDSVGKNVNNAADKIDKGINLAVVTSNVFRLALRAVENEITTTIRDIESIPGLPQSTIDSVNQMKYALEANNSFLKQGAAWIAGTFSEIGTGLGYALGAAAYGADAAADGFKRMQSEADAFAHKDFSNTFTNLQTQFDRLAVTNKGKMAAMLQDEAAQLDQFAQTGVVSLGKYQNTYLENLRAQMQDQGGASVADMDAAQLKAMQDKIAAQRTINELVQSINGDMNSVTTLYERQSRAAMSTQDALKQVNAELAQLYQKQMPDITDKATLNDPVALQAALDNWNKIKELESEHLALLRKSHEWVNTLASDLSNAATDAALHWNKFGDVISNLGDEIVTMGMKLMVINPILNAVFGASGLGISGFTSLPTYGGARASGGNVSAGNLYKVNENGVELFQPNQNGTIIPAGASSGPATKAGDTYYIDATGADPAAISRLAGAIASVNGSIEMRAVAAVLKKSNKSTTFRRATS